MAWLLIGLGVLLALWWLPVAILLCCGGLSEHDTWRWLTILALCSWLGLAWYLASRRPCTAGPPPRRSLPS